MTLTRRASAHLRVVGDQSSDGTRAARPRPVILGVAASDAHAVANHFIAYHLRSQGFDVVNLGTCTPVAEFCDALRRTPEPEALIIGSLNGHAYEDLRELRVARRDGLINCPVILGGNLSVGSRKRSSDLERLYALGVDYILDDPIELVPLLDRLSLLAVPSAASG